MYNFNFSDESNELVSEYETVSIDERFDGFSGIDELTQRERNGLAYLISQNDPDKILGEMQDSMLDGDPDCGWRSVLTTWIDGVDHD